VPLFLLIIAAGCSIVLTREFYGKKRAFPRDPSEFRAPSQLSAAIAEAEAVLQKDPANIQALTEIAVAHFEQGPGKDADGNDLYIAGLKHLERARESGALDDRLFYYAAVMYETKGLGDDAAQEYEKFLRHHPDDLETRLRLGNVYYRLGELDKAIEQYERVRAEKPRDPRVAFNLAVVYRDRERWADGLKVLEEVRRNSQPLAGGEHKLLGDLYRGLGDWPQALEHYRTELTSRPDDPELWEALATGYEQAGDDSSALGHWRRFLDINPKNRKAKEKIRTLERRVKAAERKAAAEKKEQDSDPSVSSQH